MDCIVVDKKYLVLWVSTCPLLFSININHIICFLDFCLSVCFNNLIRFLNILCRWSLRQQLMVLSIHEIGIWNHFSQCQMQMWSIKSMISLILPLVFVGWNIILVPECKFKVFLIFANFHGLINFYIFFQFFACNMYNHEWK